MNVEVDCTPEEARRFLGLPDLTAVHEAYVAKMIETMTSGVSVETVETMLKSWGPMGEAGMRVWQQMFDQIGASRK